MARSTSARSSTFPPSSGAALVRASWHQLCRDDEFRGRWVALDNVRYCPQTSQPLEADVVDVDDDLASLCQRMRASDRHACCVLQCNPVTPSIAPSRVSRPPAMH